MNLNEAKMALEEAESSLADAPYIIISTFERNNRSLHLGVTERLRRIAKRGRVWKSNPFLTALKNAEYGFDEAKARSAGGSDGIFLLDRNFRLPNPMMRKIFDQYLDKETESVAAVARELNATVDQLRAVRLVSHHMRLLGLLYQDGSEDWLILIDYEGTK